MSCPVFRTAAVRFLALALAPAEQDRLTTSDAKTNSDLLNKHKLTTKLPIYWD